MNASKLIAALRRVLPAASVIAGEEALRPYECDGLSVYRCLPAAVALPENEAQVAAVLQVCRDLSVPVVFRGAGTGLSGGALPVESSVLLSLAKLNKILAIDPLARTARVQPGVRNLAVSEAARAYGLFYAPDPSSQIACTIGGNVAENSGGVHCVKYGLTVHNLLALRAVTLDGDVLELGSGALDAPGYDLMALMTGSEGMLAVVTEATLRLLPRPQTSRVIVAAFDDLQRAGDAVANIIARGVIPAGLEMMDRLAVEAAEAYVGAGYPLDAEAILLAELDGTPEELAEDIMRLRDILLESGAVDFRTAENEAECSRLWAGRKAAFPAVGRLAPDYYCMDGTIPRKHLATVLLRIRALSAQYGLPVANVFHAGDGNLHPLILYDANQSDELARAEAFGADILKLCIDMGGTITGEHGVGVEKLGPMCLQFDAAALDVFHRIKHAFDPAGLLNPGKAVPSLHRCAEMGRMHVHAGQTAFPDLPRF